MSVAHLRAELGLRRRDRALLKAEMRRPPRAPAGIRVPFNLKLAEDSDGATEPLREVAPGEDWSIGSTRWSGWPPQCRAIAGPLLAPDSHQARWRGENVTGDPRLPLMSEVTLTQ